MMTNESLQVITDADQDTDFEVRVSEVFELRLPAMPTTGHLWEFSERRLFLARRGSQTVGRIAAMNAPTCSTEQYAFDVLLNM